MPTFPVALRPFAGTLLVGLFLGGTLAAPEVPRALTPYLPARVVPALWYRLTGPPAADTLEVRLQATLEHHVRTHPSVPGAVLSVTAPGLRFTGAAGNAAHTGEDRLTTSTPFRSASVTKTFTAAATLRLADRGRLGLDDLVARHLPGDLARRLPGVTVRHLLSHTGGLPDYATDPDWLLEVATHPRRRWTPRELINRGLDRHRPAAPGAAFHYSDTGYALLGLVLEEVTGQPLARALRTLLPLNALPATHLEGREPAPPGPPAQAHAYLGPLDLTGHHPSFDTAGGGGLVTTATDLDRFTRALFAGRLFRRPATLRAMLRTVAAGDGRAYGLGIGHMRLAGEEVWFHEGFFGAFILHVPRLRLTAAGTVNQNQGAVKTLMTRVVEHVQTRGDQPLCAVA